MPFFKDSYATTNALPFEMKTTRNAIIEAMIKSGLRNENGGIRVDDGNVKPVFIFGRNDVENKIPLFFHPILVRYESTDYLCTDMRLFVRKEGLEDGDDPVPRNPTEFNFNKARGILNLIWLNGGSNQIKNGLSFANVVFSTWLSDAIGKTFALDPKDRTLVGIIASFYYQTLFTEENSFDEDLKQKMILHSIKVTKAPADLVMSTIDRIGPIKTIHDFCTAVKDILENVRLEKFNLTMLLTIVSNSWFGTNAKFIISAALEHPPTWCAVVFAALNERTYKASQIYRVTELVGKRGAGDEFNSTFKALMLDAKA